jgi:hypothetical protein
MSDRPTSSTNLQEYEATADGHSGTSTAIPTAQSLWLARQVAGAVMWGMARPLGYTFEPANPPIIKSSTMLRKVNPIFKRQIERLFNEGSSEFFQDGVDSNFSRSLLRLLKADSVETVNAIAEYLIQGEPKEEVASEALTSISEFENQETLTHRWDILRRSLASSSAIVRDGAILGFANLDHASALPELRKAREKEPLVELRRLLDRVIEQLNRR